MSAYSADHQDAVELVDDACQRLFDMWCESRSVIPLGYLLHCWPLPDKRRASVQRLADGMRELSRADPDALGGRIWPVICDLVLHIDELLLYRRM